MQAYSIQQAKENFGELLDAALHGETVLIQINEYQAVQLTPTQLVKKPRKAGSARNLISISDDFDAPLSDFSEYEE